MPNAIPQNDKPQISFKEWRERYAPHDSGQDYDLVGAWRAGLKPSGKDGHFPDTFKLPNHPTFSIESKYWKPGLAAGRWEGDKYIRMSPTEANTWVQQHGQNLAPPIPASTEPQSNIKPSNLLQDILGFAKEGLQKAGQYSGEQTQKSGDILKAIQAGKPIPRGQSGSLLQSALGMAPIGMISPANWASTEPEVKALINTLGDKFPNFFKKILGDPRELLTLTAPSKATDMGPLASSLGEYVPLSGGASGGIKLSPEIFSNIEGQGQPVLAHEMQHYLNAAMPEFKGTASTVSGAIDPALGDKYERIASMIHDQLPRGGRGSLSQRLGQSMFLKSGGVPQELEGLVQKAGSPQALLPHLQKAAFDEALAHLTEHTVRQGTPQGLLDLATQMGVGAQ